MDTFIAIIILFIATTGNTVYLPNDSRQTSNTIVYQEEDSFDNTKHIDTFIDKEINAEVIEIFDPSEWETSELFEDKPTQARGFIINKDSLKYKLDELLEQLKDIEKTVKDSTNKERKSPFNMKKLREASELLDLVRFELASHHYRAKRFANMVIQRVNNITYEPEIQIRLLKIAEFSEGCGLDCTYAIYWREYDKARGPDDWDKKVDIIYRDYLIKTSSVYTIKSTSDYQLEGGAVYQVKTCFTDKSYQVDQHLKIRHCNLASVKINRIKVDDSDHGRYEDIIDPEGNAQEIPDRNGKYYTTEGTSKSTESNTASTKRTEVEGRETTTSGLQEATAPQCPPIPECVCPTLSP